MTWQITQGDCRELLRAMPEGSVHCAVTSPPYWGMRDYKLPPLLWGGDQGCEHVWGEETFGAEKGNTIDARIGSHKKEALASSQGAFCQLCGCWRGSLGLEPSIEQYIAHLLEVTAGLKRVLRDDGVFWCNLGDTYAANRSYQVPDSKWRNVGNSMPMSASGGLKPLDMCGIPWRVALALQEKQGWYLRSAIVWEKPNPMPESMAGVRWEQHRVKVKAQAIGTSPQRIGAVEGLNAKPQRNAPGGEWQGAAQWADCPGCARCSPNQGLVLRRGAWRPTSSYEYVFMLTKSDKYYGDAEAVREDGVMPAGQEAGFTSEMRMTQRNEVRAWAAGKTIYTGKRNLRDVWRMNTQPFAGAHFATFPVELPGRCIKASTSEHGVCPKCGSPWARVIEGNPDYEALAALNRGWSHGDDPLMARMLKGHPSALPWKEQTLGWRATCAHGDLEPVPATVLDPFVGSGSSAIAAVRLGRDFVGFDLSEAYVKMARKRIAIEAAQGNTPEIAQAVGEEVQLGLRMQGG